MEGHSESTECGYTETGANGRLFIDRSRFVVVFNVGLKAN